MPSLPASSRTTGEVTGSLGVRTPGAPVNAIPALAGDRQLVRAIFGKWSPELLTTLNSVPTLGFQALGRALPGISPRVLSLKLRALADQKLIERQVLDARPPRVIYSLTDRGRTIVGLVNPVLRQLRGIDPARADGASPSMWTRSPPGLGSGNGSDGTGASDGAG
jgi:DNA-binding HxlR family transcriptional regulator